MLSDRNYGLNKLTRGTNTPLAPASKTCLICQLELAETPVAGILTKALGPPPEGTAPWIATIDSATLGTSGVKPCSQSIMTHERCGGPAWATVRAWKTPGRVIQAPKAVLLALKALIREWDAMLKEVMAQKRCDWDRNTTARWLVYR